MAESFSEAVRNGTMEAGRLHRRLGTRELVEGSGRPVDVFGTIHGLSVPLLLRPLQGLLGAYLREPIPGILVTTERPMSVQRFTAAHELGHFALDHRPSLDDENILRRMPNSPDPSPGLQETEADAFAIAFMMPRWLILSHCARQGWTVAELASPGPVYQLSLRLGASYEATCRTLFRHRLVDRRTLDRLVAVKPRDLKVALLGHYRPPDYKGDAWLLTERDAGSHVEGSRNDQFVLRLTERSGAGYVWDIDELAASGFAIVGDLHENRDTESVGGPTIRRVTAAATDGPHGRLALAERRPWMPAEALTTLSLGFDLTGPEPKGLSRAERRARLAA